MISTMILGKPLWVWGSFLSLILFLLFLDLGFFHKKNKEMTFSESVKMSLFYVSLGLLFSIWIFHYLGANAGYEYLNGFLVEKTLSIDNIFMMSVIFSYFQIPARYQHRVIFYGILGVLILRAILIGCGAVMVQNYSWILDVFSVFLILMGLKMLFLKEKEVDLESNVILKWMKKTLRVTPQLHGEQFMVRLANEQGQKQWFFTPLFLCLMLIELVDLIFALDSIPAIFNITSDPYIVYTSNIFAILGLRALYFVLADMIQRFHGLKIALALILIFIGAKGFVADFLGIAKIPPVYSLGVTLSLLLGGIAASYRKVS